MKAVFGTVKTGNVELPYGKAGTGDKVLIVLPGLCITKACVGVEVYTKRYDEKFLEDRTVFIIDRPVVIPEGYTMENRAEDLTEALPKLGVGDFDLFGASMGGVEAVYLAAMVPDRVRHLVVASSCDAMTEEIWPYFATWQKLSEEKKHLELTASFLDPIYGKDTLEKIREPFLAAVTPYPDQDLLNLSRYIRTMRNYDIRETCGRVKCPVLVTGSKGDRVFGMKPGEEIARLTGGKLLVYGEEYGHGVYDEAPDYIEHIKAFFEE